jgi:hypothetical protein
MAGATRASGERNPNAIRVRSRSFVLTISTRAFDSLWVSACVDAGAVLADGAGEFDERGQPRS